MQWENWKPKNANDKRDGEMIHNAYTNMKGMAVYAWHEADGKTETFKRWFAEADADKVKKVFERIMDMNALIPDTLPRMKNRILDRKDFKDKCKNDRFLNAYTLKKAGRFHICDNGIKQPDIDTLTCAKLDGTGSERYSSYKIRSLAGTMLHEVM